MYSFVYHIYRDLVYCRAIQSCDLAITISRCALCFRPIASPGKRVIVVSPEDTPVIGHAHAHGHDDIVAQMLFTGMNPIHDRCLSTWTDLMMHTLPYSVRNCHARWVDHCRWCTPALVRWYHTMIQAIDARDVQTLLQWPRPRIGQRPLARERIGSLFYTVVQAYFDPIVPIPMELRLLPDACDESIYVQSKHIVLSAADIKAICPHIIIQDRALFTDAGLFIPIGY